MASVANNIIWALSEKEAKPRGMASMISGNFSTYDDKLYWPWREIVRFPIVTTDQCKEV